MTATPSEKIRSSLAGLTPSDRKEVAETTLDEIMARATPEQRAQIESTAVEAFFLRSGPSNRFAEAFAAEEAARKAAA